MRLIGLKEGKKTILIRTVKKILNEGLRLLGDEYEIERSHRSGGPRPGNNYPPRLILVKFLRYTARQKVFKAVKKERGIQWEDCTLSIYEDMTKEHADQQRRFSQVMKALWDQQVKQTLAHQAILRFTWKGETLRFTEPKKALFGKISKTQRTTDCVI